MYNSLAEVLSTLSSIPAKCKFTLSLNDNSLVSQVKGDHYRSLTSTPTYTRSIAASSNWGTVILPFEAKSDAEVQLYKLKKVANNSMSFSPVATVAANTPCVFKKKVANATSVTFTANSFDVANAIATEPAAVDGLAIRGTYTKKENQTGMYFIAQDKFWKADAAITINPFRAWFEGTLPSGSNAKALSIVIEGEDDITGILQLENGELKTANSGKYLENGRVVIVKNGKKYNVNGQALR